MASTPPLAKPFPGRADVAVKGGGYSNRDAIVFATAISPLSNAATHFSCSELR